jgi:hypothetical protein
MKKIPWLVLVLLLSLAVSSCASGDLSRRDDYSSSAFDSAATQAIERSKRIHVLDPKAPKAETNEQAELEIRRQTRAERAAQAQRDQQYQFERELEASLKEK